jgi:Metalloenzyme superfamily
LKINKLITKFNGNFSRNFILWVLAFTFAVAIFIDDSMRNRMLPTHPYLEKTQNIQETLKRESKKSPSRLFVYFIDALRFKYSIDKTKMPFLYSLLPKSTWGKVTPCLTNMTVHCVEATFSGHDRSSILSFSEDFHPRKAKNRKSWMFQMHGQGHKIISVSDYVIPTLYGDLLHKKHLYKKGASQLKLTRKALKWFDDPDVSVAIVHLLGPHDLGQTYGGNSKQYIKQIKETDDILKEVVNRLKPNDTLLVYGDHGINDEGLHTYNTDTPTFYLYMGPDFTPNHRQDIKIGSHTFFLSVLFNLPFNMDYQGKFFWDSFSQNAKQSYGKSDLFKIKRDSENASLKLTTNQLAILFALALLALAGLIFQVDGIKNRPWYLWLIGIIPLSLLVYIDKSWAFPFLLLIPSALFFRKKPSKSATVFIFTLLLYLFLKAFTYRSMDLIVHDIKIHFAYIFNLLEFLVSFAIANYLLKKRSLGEKIGLTGLILSTILLIFHYPTLYFYGVIRGIPFFLIIMMGGYYIENLFKLKTTKEKIVMGSLTLLAIAFLATQISIFVENFRIFFFMYIPKDNISIINTIWAITPYFGATALLAFKSGIKEIKQITITVLLTITTTLIALGIIPLHPLVFATLLLLIIPLWFIPFKSFLTIPRNLILWFLMIPELAYMHVFHPGPFYQLTGFAFVAGVLNMLISNKKPASLDRLKLAIPYIMISIMVMVVAFGFRTCGIDFKFAVKWFPTLFEKLWMVIFTAGIIKYLFGILLISFFFGTNGRKVFKLAGSILITLQIISVIFLLFLFLVETKVPLVVDTLEETIYLNGVLTLTGVLTFLTSFTNTKNLSKKV